MVRHPRDDHRRCRDPDRGAARNGTSIGRIRSGFGRLSRLANGRTADRSRCPWHTSDSRGCSGSIIRRPRSTRSIQSRPIGACSFSLSASVVFARAPGPSPCRRTPTPGPPSPAAPNRSPWSGAAGPGRQLRCRQLPTHRLQAHLRRELGRGWGLLPRPPRRPSCRANQAHPPGRNSGVTSVIAVLAHRQWRNRFRIWGKINQ